MPGIGHPILRFLADLPQYHGNAFHGIVIDIRTGAVIAESRNLRSWQVTVSYPGAADPADLDGLKLAALAAAEAKLLGWDSVRIERELAELRNEVGVG